MQRFAWLPQGRPQGKQKTRSSALAERPRVLRIVCSQLQVSTYLQRSYLLPVTAASDLLVHKILLWLGYPIVKKFRRYLYSFWRNSRTWQTTDRQTDGLTDTAWQHKPRLCIASRGKNNVPILYRENWPKSTAVITGVIFTCPGRAGPVFRLDGRLPSSISQL